MNEEELKQKAEDFVIDRYKIAECYREDNAETREYMRMDVHSQYEEEYQLYLDATKELEEENAELKKKNLDTQDAVTMQMYTNKANKEIADRQLTKAKELLNEFMRISKASDEDFEHDYSELIAETEQFIKNSEVKK